MSKNETGFSLVAVLIAMVILSVGVLAVSQTSFVVLRVHRDVAARTAALSVARAYLEELRSRDPGALASESPVLVDERGQANFAGPYTRSVKVDGLAKNLKRVTVTVTAPRLSAPVQLVTNAFVNN